LRQLLAGKKGRWSGGEIVRVGALQEPCGGAPIAFLFGGGADGTQGFDFEGFFRHGKLTCKLLIPRCESSDGAGRAAHIISRNAPAAAIGDDGENGSSLGVGEHGEGKDEG